MTHPLEGLAGGSNFNNSSTKRGNGNGNGKGRIKPATLRAYKYTTPDKGLAEEVFILSEGKPKFLLIDPNTGEPILHDSINAIHEISAIIKPQDINGSNPNRSLPLV